MDIKRFFCFRNASSNRWNILVSVISEDKVMFSEIVNNYEAVMLWFYKVLLYPETFLIFDRM